MHRTLTGISELVKSTQKSEITPVKPSQVSLHTLPTWRYTPLGMTGVCINALLGIEHSQEFTNRWKVPRKAKLPLWKPHGSAPTPSPALKLEHIPPRTISDTSHTNPHQNNTRSEHRKNCARGSPPKTRYSGHQNSRLMRGASKQGQTKWLSYYMREGWKDKLKGSVRLNCKVIRVISWWLRQKSIKSERPFGSISMALTWIVPES